MGAEVFRSPRAAASLLAGVDAFPLRAVGDALLACARMRIPGLKLTGDLADLPWRETSDGGVQWLPLHLDETASSGARRGGATVLIRMAPGAGYGAHRHVGAEDVLVLEGGYRDELGEHHQGDHVHYPPASAHAPVALGDPARPAGPGNPACILYATAPLGIELLRDATRSDNRRVHP